MNSSRAEGTPTTNRRLTGGRFPSETSFDVRLDKTRRLRTAKVQTPTDNNNSATERKLKLKRRPAVGAAWAGGRFERARQKPDRKGGCRFGVLVRIRYAPWS